MTFRLVNRGLREVWDQNEFMYHTWHPGQAGTDNYFGPHDGMHMSLAAFEALASKRQLPFRENNAIAALRTAGENGGEKVLGALIDPSYLREWNIGRLKQKDWLEPIDTYRGFRLRVRSGRVVASPVERCDRDTPSAQDFEGNTAGEVKRQIDQATPARSRVIHYLAVVYVVATQVYESCRWRLRSTGTQLARLLASLLTVLLIAPAMLLVVLAPYGLGRRARAARTKVNGLSQILDNVAAVLDRLLRSKTKATSSVFVAADKATLIFLGLIRALRLLPQFRSCGPDPAQIEAQLLAESKDKTSHLLIVVPRNFFAQFHCSWSPGRNQFSYRTIIA
jgi:hypothetical protein